jgi:hypothetical protein
MALSTQQRRVADHLGALAEQGLEIARLEKPSSVGPYIQNEDKVTLHAWLTRVKNIVANTFGEGSQHYHHLQTLTKRDVEHSYQVLPIVGLLQGARTDLEEGFLVGQELLIAGEVFDSVLDQAAHLNDAGHKDPAAVLCRVVLEDALKRLSTEEGINPDQKATQLNDELKKTSRYAQPQWRLVQHWLDIGNASAHGEFDSYDQRDVARLIEDVRRFAATELRV